MIAFPRLMPTVGIVSKAFQLQRTDYLSPEQGGRLGAMGGGPPLWSLSLGLGDMSFEHDDLITAFVDGQRGPMRRFLAFDIGRQMPRFHAGGVPYRETPSSWSHGISAESSDAGTAYLTLVGLLPGQVVSTGDYVGFGWGDGRCTMVRAQESASATAGGLVAFAVEPALPRVVPAGAVATLRRATCLMRLVPGQTTLGEHGLGYVSAGGRITALQDLVP